MTNVENKPKSQHLNKFLQAFILQEQLCSSHKTAHSPIVNWYPIHISSPDPKKVNNTCKNKSVSMVTQLLKLNNNCAEQAFIKQLLDKVISISMLTELFPTNLKLIFRK